MKPRDLIRIMAAIGDTSWKPLTADDHALFADAGDDALIAHDDFNQPSLWRIAEIAEVGFAEEQPLLAIIGGAAMQLELHGLDQDGAPIAFILGLRPDFA